MREDRRVAGGRTTTTCAPGRPALRIAAMTTSAAVASHTGQEAGGDRGVRGESSNLRGLIDRPVGGGDGGLAATTGHSDQVRRTVSMMA